VVGVPSTSRVDTTPVIAGTTVLVAGEKMHARRLGPQPGWDAAIRAMSEERSAPAAGDRAAYVVLRHTFEGLLVLAFDLATGAELWRARASGFEANRPAVDGGDLFVAGRSLVALDPDTGAERWSVRTDREYTGAIAVTATHVVGATGRLAGLEPGDDRPEWSFTVVCVDRRTRAVAERMAFSGVTVADGVAYTVGHDDRGGTLYAVDVATGRLVWRSDVGPSSALPAVAGGMMYVSNMDGEVLAFQAVSRPDNRYHRSSGCTA
jgi:outer membrane protein assembly factor BamB